MFQLQLQISLNLAPKAGLKEAMAEAGFSKYQNEKITVEYIIM